MFKRSDDEIKELFYKLETRYDVADILEIDEKSLRYFLYVLRPENLYEEFSIKKKNGGERKICAPEIKFKNIQRKLAYILSLIYEPKVCSFGFIKGKSILNNAEKHIKRNQLLNIDLENFFTQIHFGRVRGMLLKPPYNISNEAATTIAQIACYNGYLPQGAPSSPILTNMICKPLDNQLMRLAKNNNLTYSRYADDITFSSYTHDFPMSIINGDVAHLQIGNDLKNILSRNSFIVNEKKIFLNSSDTRQEVTGLVVNKFPNIKRNYTKNLRAILHNCKSKGIYLSALNYINKGLCKNSNIISKSKDSKYEKEIVQWFKNVLKGKINFIKQIKGSDSATFLKFAEQINDVFNEQVFDISLFDEFRILIENNVFVLEYIKDDEYIQGTGFLLKGYGLFTSFHVIQSGKPLKVYKHTEYDESSICTIMEGTNSIINDKDIDYALYDIKCNDSCCFELGDSTKLKIGDQVIIIGYPNFQKGDSPYVQTCEITSITTYFGSGFYTVGGRIVHGASGGVVLNKRKQIVGIIKGGVETLKDEDKSDKQGFIPIHVVINDINSKNIESLVAIN